MPFSILSYKSTSNTISLSGNNKAVKDLVLDISSS
nr:MAG TPA: hypothetical protein [Crassvirales sp.]